MKNTTKKTSKATENKNNKTNTKNTNNLKPAKMEKETKKTETAKRAKLTSPEQITTLANNLGRKASKNDLLNAFVGLEWQKDKQGRAQNLILNGQIIRSDNKIFYPNAEKPAASGKHLSGATRTNWGQKVAKLFEAMQAAAANLGVDFAAAGVHSIEQAAAALDEAAAKVEAAKVEAATAKHTEKLNKAAARFSVADLEKMLEARKAAANA